MARERKLGLVLSSQDYEAADVAVTRLLDTLGALASRSEVQVIPVAEDVETGKRIYVRKIVAPQVDDKTLVKLTKLDLPNTVKVKIFET